MDFFDDGFDWEDIAIIGSMAEDMADEERKRNQIEKEQQNQERLDQENNEGLFNE